MGYFDKHNKEKSEKLKRQIQAQRVEHARRVVADIEMQKFCKKNKKDFKNKTGDYSPAEKIEDCFYSLEGTHGNGLKTVKKLYSELTEEEEDNYTELGFTQTKNTKSFGFGSLANSVG